MFYNTAEKKLKPRIIIHGAEGVGKSTFASQFPNPIFVTTEDGLRGIETNAYPLANTWDEFKTYVGDACKHGFETLVVDSADWAEKLLVNDILDKQCPDSLDKSGKPMAKTLVNAGGGYGAGYEILQREWLKFLNVLQMYNTQHDMGIIMICHTALIGQKDAINGEYDRAVINLYQSKSNPNSGVRGKTVEWADVVGYAYQPAVSTRSGNSTIMSKDFSGSNMLAVESHPAYHAKNKYGIKNCRLDFVSFSSQFEGIYS